MYGGFRVHVHAPADQVRQAAEIMYYAGDLAELLLAAALVTTWRPARPARAAADGPGRCRHPAELGMSADGAAAAGRVAAPGPRIGVSPRR